MFVHHFYSSCLLPLPLQYQVFVFKKIEQFWQTLCLLFPTGVDSDQPGFAHVKSVYSPVGSLMHWTLLSKILCEPLHFSPLLKMPSDCLDSFKMHLPLALPLCSYRKVVLALQSANFKKLMSNKGSLRLVLFLPRAALNQENCVYLYVLKIVFIALCYWNAL